MNIRHSLWMTRKQHIVGAVTFVLITAAFLFVFGIILTDRMLQTEGKCAKGV